MAQEDMHKKLLLLFDRPKEPVFNPKGEEKAVFQVPLNLLADEHKQVSIPNRLGEDVKELVDVKDIAPPNLGEIISLDRFDNFSLFIPKHRKLAGELIRIFMDANLDDLLSTAIYARERVNPLLFNYAYTVALLHRPDTRGVEPPSVIRTFPDKFLDGKVFKQAREDAHVIPDGARMPIEVPLDYTASDLDQEHRIAYFREDIGLNIHHWHWHLVYPFEGPRQIVAKNRRGELFYYMHEQIQARYNFERLCNRLGRVKRLNNLREPVPEAYFPKLDNLVAGRTWAGRPANMTPKDIVRDVDAIRLDIEDMERWRARIFDAIHSGFITDDRGTQVMLTENEGIDILGDVIESSILSRNRSFYGDFHNMGHVLLAYMHDPDHRHLEKVGIMGDPAVDLRDPIFFRWHAYIDDMFQKFKETLPRYNENQLNYNGVTVDKIEVISQNSQPNFFNTFWQQTDMDLSRGMDFQPRGAVFVRFTHLQNQEFSYRITVNNTGNNRMGTCRIFMAPKFDERGNPWLFRDQRLMFIEMDRFSVSLKQGKNTISRKSTDSSITTTFENTFRDLDTNRPSGGTALDAFNFCGCGWPQHMLVPKGSPEGFPCQLFVMVTNYADDRVEQTVPTGPCQRGDTFCGIKDKLYPDRRSMGFPFDRAPRDGVNTLQQFLTPNMRVQDVIIKFSNKILRRKN